MRKTRRSHHPLYHGLILLKGKNSKKRIGKRMKLSTFYFARREKKKGKMAGHTPLSLPLRERRKEEGGGR